MSKMTLMELAEANDYGDVAATMVAEQKMNDDFKDIPVYEFQLSPTEPFPVLSNLL